MEHFYKIWRGWLQYKRLEWSDEITMQVMHKHWVIFCKSMGNLLQEQSQEIEHADSMKAQG